MFRYDKDSILVNVPVLEVYVPYEYSEAGLMEISGQEIRLFGVLCFKDYKSEAEANSTRNGSDKYSLGISGFIGTKPSERDIEEISLYKETTQRKVIILRYFKNDVFIINRNIIKSVDNVSALLELLDQGKLDNIEYDIVPDVIEKAQEINGMSLKVPPESIYAMVAERYRNPDNPSQKVRHMKKEPRVAISITPREGAATTSTFSGVTFEDVNSALVAAHNRKAAGIKEEDTVIEKIIKGEEMQ